MFSKRNFFIVFKFKSKNEERNAAQSLFLFFLTKKIRCPWPTDTVSVIVIWLQERKNIDMHSTRAQCETYEKLGIF